MFAKKTQAALMLAASAALLGACASYDMDEGQMASASADSTVMVGGAAMYPTRNIIENAVNSKDHTTLVAAVKAAGLVDTLSGPGPFTVFAPCWHGRHAAEAREQGDADQDPDLSRGPGPGFR